MRFNRLSRRDGIILLVLLAIAAYVLIGGGGFDWSRLLFVLPAIIIALTFHEYAHARMSYHFGDETAKNAGRLTLNPLKHLDPVGTLLLIFVGFGWAKPVPINPWYYQGNRKRKVLAVAAAGPLMNLLEALVAAGILSLIYHFGSVSNLFVAWLVIFLEYFIWINIVLAVFNLIPIPPLDGSKILAGILPDRFQNVVYALESYGMIIMLILVMTGLVGRIISPVASWINQGLFALVGLA